MAASCGKPSRPASRVAAGGSVGGDPEVRAPGHRAKRLARASHLLCPDEAAGLSETWRQGRALVVQRNCARSILGILRDWKSAGVFCGPQTLERAARRNQGISRPSPLFRFGCETAGVAGEEERYGSVSNDGKR